MTNILKWRLGKLPTSEEVRNLVNDKLITKEEARDILFNQETEEDIKLEDLKSEIKFLRELVEKLSSKTRVVEVIKEIYQPYHNYQWYSPYGTWCGTISTSGSLACSTDSICTTATSLVGSTNAYYVGSASGSGNIASGSGTGYGTETASSFSDIKTF